MIDLYNGDCLIESDKIESGSVDLILTDLPYGTTACSWDEIIPFEAMWKMFYRVLRPNGFIVLTASQPFTTKLIASNIDNFSHQWIWKKEQGSNPLLANVMPMKNFEDIIVFSNEYKKYDLENKHPQREYFKKVMDFIGLSLKQINNKLGHRRAEHTFYINSTQYSLCTEKTYIELIENWNIHKMEGFKGFKELYEENQQFLKDEFEGKNPRIYNPQKTKGTKYTSGSGFIEHLGTQKDGGTISDERYPESIISFNTDKRNSKHPTSKPVALMEYLIKTYTNKGNLVFDATMGSGSTGVACNNTNRDFIGIELDEKYFAIANERINKPKDTLF